MGLNNLSDYSGYESCTVVCSMPYPKSYKPYTLALYP